MRLPLSRRDTPVLSALLVGALVALSASSGCTDEEEFEFIADYEELYCDAYVLCASDEMLRVINHRECLEYYRGETYPDTPDCRFDPDAASACVELLRTAGCSGDDPELPAVCDDVYSGCLYPTLPPADGPEFEVAPETPDEETDGEG